MKHKDYIDSNVYPKLSEEQIEKFVRMMVEIETEVDKNVKKSNISKQKYIERIEPAVKKLFTQRLFEMGLILPNSNCKKCYGRGYTAMIPLTDKNLKPILDSKGKEQLKDYILCKCINQQNHGCTI